MKEAVRGEIESFVSRHQERHATETRWRGPLVGFASAADPLFAQLKSVVSPSHSLPEDLLPGARTIVARSNIEGRGHRVFVTPATHNFDREKLMSDWSHRHVALAVGLGSFGLNNMLITRRGCCGRLGSFLTTLEIAPDGRTAAEACLHRAGRSCARCVERCVNGALSAERFDRKRCYARCLQNGAAFKGMGKADVCGKCVVGLPCSFTDPVSRNRLDR